MSDTRLRPLSTDEMSTLPPKALAAGGRSGLTALLLSALALLWIRPAAAGATVRYWAWGDSITAGEGFDGANCDCEICGYPWRLQNALKAAGIDAKVENLGVGGENTLEGLERLSDRLNRGAGNVLLLKEGTNDIKANHAISPETTAFDLDEMGRMAEEKGMEVVHMTLLPRIPTAKFDSTNVETEARSRDVRDLAALRGRQLVDPFHIFRSIPNVFETLYSDCSPTDPVGHPNPEGFDLLSESIFDVLMEEDRVPPVIASTEPETGAEEVPGTATIRVRLVDLLSGVDLDATRMWVQGTEVAFSSSAADGGVDLNYRPTTSLAGEVVVEISTRDLAGNQLDEEAMRFSANAEIPGSCEPSSTVLCIDDEPGDRRFHLTLSWHTALNGGDSGEASPLQLDVLGVRRGGLFSFFDANNPEALVKVLNGCSINDRFWVFSSPTTTLGFTLTITDTLAASGSAEPSEYQYVISNKDGVKAPAVSDIQAFSTCGYGTAP